MRETEKRGEKREDSLILSLLEFQFGLRWTREHGEPTPSLGVSSITSPATAAADRRRSMDSVASVVSAALYCSSEANHAVPARHPSLGGSRPSPSLRLAIQATDDVNLVPRATEERSSLMAYVPVSSCARFTARA